MDFSNKTKGALFYFGAVSFFTLFCKLTCKSVGCQTSFYSRKMLVTVIQPNMSRLCICFCMLLIHLRIKVIIMCLHYFVYPHDTNID